MRYDPAIHHRRSIRLQGYDYTQAGAYFVTICTQGREYLFGEIADGQMRLNAAGEIAAATWEWLAAQHSYVELDAWTVMPNHLHGILVLLDVSSEKKKPLGRLIGAFKTVSTKRVNALRGAESVPLWQRNYWERVIRNEQELQAVREYIQNNPARWAEDQLNADAAPSGITRIP